jgi:glycosyltransferase involved in cell wall biosynthesis
VSLRIVHVVCSPQFAGTERHVAELARAQSGAGHQVHVLGGDARMRASVGPDVDHVEADTVARAVRALTRLRRVDVVHAHMSDAEVAAALAPCARATTVSTRHFAALRGSDPMRRAVTRLAARRLDGQIAISHYVADRVDGPSTVIYPGVPDRDPAPAEGREPIVLLAQRLEPEKAGDIGLRAFAASGLPGQGWRLLVAGDGSGTSAFARLATDLGVADRVDLLGHRLDVPDLMARASLLVAPCPVEGLGLTVLESMASGLPVVAAGSGGHLETVGAVPGAALFPPGDVAAAAGWLDELGADEHRRGTYAADLADVQRRRFTVGTWERDTAAFYEALL